MAQLKIREKYITDLENFEWGEKWRAISLIKERRVSGDVYFGLVVRYYGTTDDTNDYDVGDRSKDFAWLGRHIKYVGKRVHDVNPDSKTVGKRIWQNAITEKDVIINAEGYEEEVEDLVEGKAIWQFDIKDTSDNVKRLKTLVGQVDLDKITTFAFIQGTSPPISVDEDTFFNKSVKSFLSAHTIQATIMTNAENSVK